MNDEQYFSMPDLMKRINDNLNGLGSNKSNWCYDLSKVPYKADGGHWQQYKDTKDDEFDKFMTIVKDSDGQTVAVVEYKKEFDQLEKVYLLSEWYK